MAGLLFRLGPYIVDFIPMYRHVADPFPAKKTEQAPNAFDYFVNSQKEKNNMGRPFKIKAGYKPEWNRDNPKEKNVGDHQKPRVAPGAENAFG
jgi:hypothetical protein